MIVKTPMVKRFNDYTVPSNSATEVIRSLERDAKKDKSWFDRYFRPTIEEFRERKESLMRTVDHDPVGNLVREHPWVVVKAAEHTLKRSVVSAGVTMVLGRISLPLAVVATAIEGYNIYKSFTEYMEGGKDAVTRNCSSRSGPSRAPKQQKERIIETKQTQEARWKEMKASGEWEHRGGFSKPTLRHRKTGDLVQKSIEKWDIEVYGKNELHKGVIRPSEGFVREELAVAGRRIK
jgi:hypothetical protein